MGLLQFLIKAIDNFKYVIVAMILALLLFFIPDMWGVVYPQWYDTKQPYVIFFDVGQGDATLLISQKHVILIDTGPDISTINQLDKYIPYFNRTIDILILTHPHEDHIGELEEVLTRYQVQKLIINPVCNDNKKWEDLLDGQAQESTSTGIEEAFDNNESLRIGELDIKLEHVNEEREGNCEKSFNGNYNDDSLVVLVQVEAEGVSGKSIMIMGDLETSGEKALVQEEAMSNDTFLRTDIDILKAGHHCSKTSTSDKLLDQLKPELVICSVGKDNRYGHPSKVVLDRLESKGIEYKLTYETGNIVIPLR